MAPVAERDEVIDALTTYGRMLTVTEPPQKGPIRMEKYLRGLQKNLVQMRRPSIIIIGQPRDG